MPRDDDKRWKFYDMSEQKQQADDSSQVILPSNNSPGSAFWNWTLDKDTKIRWTAYQRTANEFLVYAAGYWSMIYIIFQLLLKLLSTPEFSFTLLTPLWASCLITGAVTLGLSIYYTYQFYQLHISDTEFVDILNDNKKVQDLAAKKLAAKKEGISFKQQSLYYWDKVHTFLIDSYAVMSIASIFVFLITSVFGASVIHAALIIGAAVAVGYGITSTTINHSGSNNRQEAIQKSKNNFNATLKNVNHLIGLRKDKRLLSARNLETQRAYFTQLAGKSEQEQQQFSRTDLEVHYKIAIAEASLYFNYVPTKEAKDLNINEMATELGKIIKTIPAELETNYRTAITLKQKLLTASRTDGKKFNPQDNAKLSPQQCKEIEETDKEEFSFNNWEKWDIFCAFIEFKAGSIIYLSLPIILDMMGIPPLSTEVFWGIIIGAGVVYGLINGFYKIKTLEEEKWLHIDNREIAGIRNDDDPNIFEEINRELAKPIEEPQPTKTPVESSGWLADLSDSFHFDTDSLYQSLSQKTAAFIDLFHTPDGSTPPSDAIKYLPDPADICNSQ